MKNTYFIFIVFFFALVACKKETEKPAVETVRLTYIDSFSVQLEGNVIADGGADVTHTGFIVASSISAIDRVKEDGIGSRSALIFSSLNQNSRRFTSMAIGLSFNQEYYYVAFAANKNGMAYSEVYTFTIDGRSYPIVNTIAASNIDKTESTLNAEIEVDGNENISERGFFWSEIANPNSSSAKLVYSGTNNTFGANLTGLVENNTYYFRAYCINNGVMKLGEILSFKTNTDMPANMVDIDGNIYPVVKIGAQVWAAENLRTTKFADGSSIPYVSGSSQWESMSSAARCFYNNDANINSVSGTLYNWYATVDPRKLCPNGWHVSTDQDWKTMETFLGMPASELENFAWRGESENVGGKLKKTTGWSSPNSGATNETGFNSIASGYRSWAGLFVSQSIFNNNSIWTSTQSTPFPIVRGMLSDRTGVVRANTLDPRTGYSIRCVKD